MGCDGIWERKSNEVMVEWISSRLEKLLTPAEILEELLDEELADNGESTMGRITCLLFSLCSRIEESQQ